MPRHGQSDAIFSQYSECLQYVDGVPRSEFCDRAFLRDGVTSFVTERFFGMG